MTKQNTKAMDVEMSSGNVFADLSLSNAEKLKIKSGLMIEIARAVRELGLTQEEAGRRMGIPQPKVSALVRGEFENLSERKLMQCLNRLGYDIEIRVKPASAPVGRLTLAFTGRRKVRSERASGQRSRDQRFSCGGVTRCWKHSSDASQPINCLDAGPFLCSHEMKSGDAHGLLRTALPFFYARIQL